MNHSSQIWIIASREFIQRASSRVFLFTMIGLSGLIVVGIFFAASIGGDPEALRLGVAGDSPDGIVSDIEQSAAALERDVVVTEYASVPDATAAVESGSVEAVLVDGSTILSNRTPSRETVAILTSAANAGVRRETAEQLGLSEADVAAILVPVQVNVVELDPEDPDEVARYVASFLSALVLLTAIMMFGQFVAMGVVEEKQNRVVELVLAKARASSLLVGKVLGIGALGLLQIAALGFAAVLGLMLAPVGDLGVPDLTSIGVTAALWLGLWFTLGYLVYSFTYAALGATISRQEDLQSVAFIPALLILPAYFIVTFTIGSTEPSTIARIGSYFPYWSPILMPYRINTGDAAAWEVVLAIALTVSTAFLLVWGGARIYRGAALRTGGKVSLRQAWSDAER